MPDPENEIFMQMSTAVLNQWDVRISLFENSQTFKTATHPSAEKRGFSNMSKKPNMSLCHCGHAHWEHSFTDFSDSNQCNECSCDTFIEVSEYVKILQEEIDSPQEEDNAP